MCVYMYMCVCVYVCMCVCVYVYPNNKYNISFEIS